MTGEPAHVAIDEFVMGAADILDRVIRERQTVVIETADGPAIVLRPVRPRRAAARAARSRQATRDAAGSWKDIDAEAFKSYIYDRRRTARRPRVDP